MAQSGYQFSVSRPRFSREKVEAGRVFEDDQAFGHTSFTVQLSVLLLGFYDFFQYFLKVLGVYVLFSDTTSKSLLSTSGSDKIDRFFRCLVWVPLQNAFDRLNARPFWVEKKT